VKSLNKSNHSNNCYRPYPTFPARKT